MTTRTVPQPNMSLAQLPLRPSSLSVLVRRGFDTTNDVKESAQTSIANFASELGTSLETANSIHNEVVQCYPIQDQTQSSSNENADNTSTNINTNINTMERCTAASILLDNEKHSSKNQSSGTKHNSNSNSLRPIVSFCKGIDKLLGGGFCPCEVTEIVGVPGVGKTQLAMQLCVDASLPSEFGGVAGKSIYIDSEGSFAPERMLAMAEALVSHVHSSARRRRERRTHHSASSNSNNNIANSYSSLDVAVPQTFNSENILKGVHVFRVHDEASQKATIYSLPDFLKKNKSVGGGVIKIIVIDSIAFHYRSSTSSQGDYMSRTRSLTSIASFLSDLASQHQLAVVVVNQMTTKMDGSVSRDGRSMSRLVPALGESWAHCTTTRLLLSHLPTSSNSNTSCNAGQQRQSLRRCSLVKSPHKPAGCANFVVLEVGIRDPTSALVRDNGHDNNGAGVTVEIGGSAEKRRRVVS